MDYKWLVSSLIIVVGIAIGFWEYLETRRKQFLIDLQGNKDAVAAVAMRVRRGSFPRWLGWQRRELFDALCVAAVFQRSGRSRSLIYGALVNAGQTLTYHREQRTAKYQQEIRETVDRITATVSRSSAYTDLKRARRMLIDLRAALRLNEDVRIRLDALELSAHKANRDWPPPDPRLLRYRTFAWPYLEGLLKRLGHLVVVGPSEGAPVIALDHHRITHKIHGVSPERPDLTPAGRWVIAAKYGQPSDERTQVRANLAEQLATIIDTHPVYGDAFSVAAVPGRRHGFSGELAKDVCKKVNKEFVSLKPRDDFSQEDPHFEVDPSEAKNVSNVRGKSVVVVDDVYRSGRTLQAAATALFSSGATEVFGLTATCTISATAPHCAHDIAPPTTPDSEQS